MDFQDFKIKNIGACKVDISFFFRERRTFTFRFGDRLDCFVALADALIENRNGKDVQRIEFRLQETGTMDMLLINYPGDVLKVEFYENTFWDSIFDDLPKQPSPPDLSFFTSWHTFTFRIINELQKHTKEEFAAAGFSYPRAQIAILNKKMIGRV